MPGATLGDNILIGRGTLVEPDVVVKDNTRIQAMCYITNGVRIGYGVFIGPGVVTTNDPDLGRHPDRPNLMTSIMHGARIGANTTILPGVTIGEEAVIGAGSVVTKDVPPGEWWWGNPARCQRQPLGFVGDESDDPDFDGDYNEYHTRLEER